MIELDPAELKDIASQLQGELNSYKGKVDELTAMKNKIDSSSDWVENALKHSFIATLDSYITTFMALEDAIDAYIQYITIKADDFEALDSAFG